MPTYVCVYTLSPIRIVVVIFTYCIRILIYTTAYNTQIKLTYTTN